MRRFERKHDAYRVHFLKDVFLQTGVWQYDMANMHAYKSVKCDLGFNIFIEKERK